MFQIPESFFFKKKKVQTTNLFIYLCTYVSRKIKKNVDQTNQNEHS